MFRKFKGLVTLFAILCVSAIAGGSAYFYFGEKAEPLEETIDNTFDESNINENITADNILENYEFGSNTNLNETYTYYFFPSTLYMEFYANNSNPESVFGYNEVILNDNGDPALDSNDQPQYRIVTNDITGTKDGFKTYYSYLKNSLNYDPSSYLAFGDAASRGYPRFTRLIDNDRDNDDGSYRVGHAYFSDPYVINNENLNKYLAYLANEDSRIGSKYYSVANASGSFETGIWPFQETKTKYYYFYNISSEAQIDVKFDSGWGYHTANNLDEVFDSLPEDALNSEIEFNNNTEVLSPKATVDVDDIYGLNLKIDTERAENFINSEDSSFPLKLDSYEGQMVHQAQYRNDRFGFWRPFYDWDDENNIDNKTSEYANAASRYLPIKIKVNGNLTPDDMAKIIPSVETSMFDNHLYFDATANGWTYALPGQYEYKTAVGGFTAKDVNYLFDIMQNPSKYADDDNVIRLFPIFSNGKKYKDGEDSVAADQGGGDALKANYTLKGTLDNFTPLQEGANGYIGTWKGKIYSEEVKLVINNDNTGSYNGVEFSYNVDQNIITGTANDDSFKLTLIYDKSNGTLSVTYDKKIPTTIENDHSPRETKLTYSSAYYQKTYNEGDDFYTINYAVLKNVSLIKDKYESISIQIDPTTAETADWKGDWITTHVLTRKAINSFIDVYGEGLYTFYFFMANRQNVNTASFGSDDTLDSSILSDLGWNNSMIDDLTSRNNCDNPNYPDNDLKNKKLLAINQVNDSIEINGNSTYKFAYDDVNKKIQKHARPVALAVEKVTNLRLVSDIPIKEDDSGTPTNDQDWSEIDKNIEEGLNNAQNFIIADKVYSIESMEDDDLIPDNRLDVNNPYIYVIQNADFRFVNNLYFQIRFSNDYIANGMNVITKYPGGDVPKYVAYNVNGQVMKFFYQGIDGGDVFIDNTKPVTGTDGGNQVTRSGFKLRDYNARGIYDILLVSINDNTSQSEQKFYMYINRHTNSFIKLFNGNPGTFNKDIAIGNTTQTDSFVSHKLPSELSTEEEEEKKDPAKDPTRDEKSSLIWNGQTYLGEYLSASTTGLSYGDKDKVSGEETLFSKNESFIDAIKRTIGVTPGLDNIYPIYDCVTGQQIAYYNSGVGRLFTSFGSSDGVSTDLNLFTIMKNYVLYIGKPISRVVQQ